MKDRDDCPVDALSAYVDGELTDAERVAVGAHLGACAACRDEVEDLRRLAGVLASEAVPPVPPNLATRIGERLDGEQAEGPAAPVPIAAGRGGATGSRPARVPARRGWLGPPLAAAAALATAAVMWTAWQAGSGDRVDSVTRPDAVASSGVALDAAEPSREAAGAREQQRRTAARDAEPPAPPPPVSTPRRRPADDRTGSHDALDDRGRNANAPAPADRDEAEATAPARADGALASRQAAEGKMTMKKMEDEVVADAATPAAGLLPAMVAEDPSAETAAGEAPAGTARDGDADAEKEDPMTLMKPAPEWVAELAELTRSLLVPVPGGELELTPDGLLRITTEQAACATFWDGAPASPPADLAAAGRDQAYRSVQPHSPAATDGALVRMGAGEPAPADVQAALDEIFALADLGARIETVGAPTTVSAAPMMQVRRGDGSLIALDPASDPDAGRLVAGLREKVAALVDAHYRAGLEPDCAAAAAPAAAPPAGGQRQP